MEIKYLGHSCFRLKSNLATVITDPFDPAMVGLAFAKTPADIVIISHQHKDHNFLEKIVGTEQRPEPLVFDAPGEYEAQDVGVVGIQSYHDEQKGASRGSNTIFVFQIDGLLICHLGDLGHTLEEKTVEEIGPVDILIVPVGGRVTIGAEQATKVVDALSPSIVIPMHYKMTGSKIEDLATVDEYLAKSGFEESEKLDKLKITKETLPEETELKILTC